MYVPVGRRREWEEGVYWIVRSPDTGSEEYEGGRDTKFAFIVLSEEGRVTWASS